MNIVKRLHKKQRSRLDFDSGMTAIPTAFHTDRSVRTDFSFFPPLFASAGVAVIGALLLSSSWSNARVLVLTRVADRHDMTSKKLRTDDDYPGFDLSDERFAG